MTTIRSEFAANLALVPAASKAAWTKPSTCKRAAKRSLLARLFDLCKE